MLPFASAPSVGTPRLLSTTTVDGKVIANTSLFTVPAGKTLVVTSAVVRILSATTITIGPSLGIGNVAGTNNIFASSAITGLTAPPINFGFVLVGLSVVTAASASVFCNVGTGATGTSLSLAVDLFGYFI